MKPQSRLGLLMLPLACSPLVLLAFYPSFGEWTVFLGRFHPVVLHLPIGILLLTTLFEILHVLSCGRLKFSTRLPLFLGALSAVLAMVLGILLMSGEGMAGALVKSHLQWGIAAAVAALVALTFRFWPSYTTRRALPWLYRFVLLVVCGIMTWASHQGASITHGETYLTDHIPWLEDAERREAEAESALLVAGSFEERMVYQDLVVPIFEGKCYECHQASKFKGKLIMETVDGLLKGGDSGPAIVPGSLVDSIALERIYLPLEDEDHMPPAKETQLSDQEIRLLEWWVEAGAPFDVTIASLAPGPDIQVVIESVYADLYSQVDSEQETATDDGQNEFTKLRQPMEAEMNKLQGQYPGIIRYVSGQSAVMSISSYHQSITDADIEVFAPLARNVHELILPESELTVASVEVINQMQALEVLVLRDSAVDDRFIQALQVPSLKSLNLFQTKITDASVKALGRHKNLEALYLGLTSITEDAFQELTRLLPDCKIIYQ